MVAYVAAQMIFGSGSRGAWTDPATGVVGDATVGPTAAAIELTTPSPVPAQIDVDRPTTTFREHAFGLHELRGLPPDVAAGTPLEIWVAWDEAVSEGPQIQRLVTKAKVARFIEPVTPEGPIVVVVNIPLRWMPDLLYGQRYGELSVTIPQA